MLCTSDVLGSRLRCDLSFQNLGILFAGKKEVPEILYQRKMQERRSRGPMTGKELCEGYFLDDVGSRDADAEEGVLREEVEREARGMNLNSVRVAWTGESCVFCLRVSP